MIFDFIIIPVDNSFIDTAYYILNKLEEICGITHVIINVNYDDSFSSRVDKSRLKKYNIITINEDYNEANTINIIFQHTGFKVETMSLQDFFNLVSNYINENENENKYKTNLPCIII